MLTDCLHATFFMPDPPSNPVALHERFPQNTGMRPIARRLQLKYLLGSLLLVGAGAQSGQTPQTVEIAVYENVALSRLGEAVLERAYEKLGIRMIPIPMPLRRALQQASAGELDGDLMRVAPTLKDMDQLIMVKVPVARVTFAIYKLGPCPARISIDELADKPVSYVRGTRALETTLAPARIQATVSALDALRHLQRGISDYAVLDEMESDALLAGKGMGDVCKVPEPLFALDLYHSLNKRHADLVPRLERVLKDMTDSGEIARIWAAQAKLAHDAALTHP